MNNLFKLLIVFTVLTILSGCGIEHESVRFVQGLDGRDGVDGQNGNAGPQGEAGVAGSNGTNGVGCSVSSVAVNEVAPNGGALVSCGDTQTLLLNGTNGANGANGAQGIQGVAGTNGTNGTNGSNATAVTAVQFCTGTGSYPSTFPEVGFCINDRLWGVYSDHGGFMTEILPGTWSSNGINSSCTFTVHAHCEVTH